MTKKIFQAVLLVLSVICFSEIAFSQTKPADFDEWLNQRVFEITKAKINQRNGTNQSEAPNLSSNTTSLVDKSSASDLVGVALDLAGLSTNSSEMKATSMSATVSAYALKAATSGRNPLDPDFYNANRDWRRVSFTLGFDYPAGKVGDINERATIFGVKYKPYDKRDASEDQDCSGLVKSAGQPAGRVSCVGIVSDSLKKTGVAFANITRQVEDFLFRELASSGKIDSKMTTLQFIQGYLGTNFPSKLLPLLTDAEIKKVDDIINDHLNPFVEFDDTTRKAIETIRKKPQISFAFLAKQRREGRPDEYMAEAIVDIGVAPRWNFTLNAAFAYQDNKLAKDSRGGMAAAELQFQMTPENKLAGRMPWLFSLGYQGSGMTNTTAKHIGQAKITIPLWEGFELPLSVSVANRTDLIKETDVKGHFGITFDVARLAQAFRGKFLGPNP